MKNEIGEKNKILRYSVAFIAVTWGAVVFIIAYFFKRYFLTKIQLLKKSTLKNN